MENVSGIGNSPTSQKILKSSTIDHHEKIIKTLKTLTEVELY